MAFIVPFLPAIAGALGANAAVVGLVTIGSALASNALARRAQRKQERAARDAYNASLRDRMQMVRSTLETRDLVLGRVRKGGQISFIASAGSRKEKLYIVLAIAGHEIDAFEQIYFNDVPVTLDGSGRVQQAPWATGPRVAATASTTVTGTSTVVTLPVTPLAGSVTAYDTMAIGAANIPSGTLPFTTAGATVTVNTTGVIAGNTIRVAYEYMDTRYNAVVRTYLGTDTQTADPGLMAALPAQWTSAHRLRRVAYLVAELTYDEDSFTTGVPNISAVVRGAKVFDPRTGTTAWSENAALLFRHAALHAYGGRLPAGSVPDADVIAAANVCDISTSYSVVRDGVLVNESRPQYTAGTVCKAGAVPRECLDDLALAMAGKWCLSGNKLRVKAGAYTSPVLTLGDDDFADGTEVAIQPRRSRQQLFNAITGSFADKDNAYRPVDLPKVVAAAYVAEDGAELPLEVTFDAVSYVGQVGRIATIMMRDARQALSITAAFKLRAYPLEVLDTIALNNSRYGWVNKSFEILGRRWTLQGGIELDLKETGPSIFTNDTSFSAVDTEPNTLLPRPWQLAALTGLALTSDSTLIDGTPQTRLRVSWNASTDQAVLANGQIEVAYARVDQVPVLTEDWPTLRVAGSATSVVIPGLVSQFHYLVRIRAVTTLARGPWSPYGAIAIGAAPPVAVFTTRHGWEFRNTTDGWTFAGATTTLNADSITVTSTGGDPIMRGSGFSVFDGQSFDRVRVRLRRLAGSGWDGTVYYTTSGHGESSSFRKVIPAPPAAGWTTLEWDMRSLTAGGADWVSNLITGIRLDLGSTAADIFEIDSISIGRYSTLVNDIGTGQILPGTATLVYEAASAGAVANPASPHSAVTFTPPITCVGVVTVSGRSSCANSSGSTLRIDAVMDISGFRSDGGAFPTPVDIGAKFITRNIANGETFEQPQTVAKNYTFLGGFTYTVGIFFSDSLGATQSLQIAGARTQVELIMR